MLIFSVEASITTKYYKGSNWKNKHSRSINDNRKRPRICKTEAKEVCHKIYGVPEYLTQRCKDSTIIFAKFLCSIIFDLMMAYVANMTQLYYGILIAGFSFGASSINKSLLSKLVDPLDVGKLFAINGAIQALVPFLSSPTFAFIYKITVASMPHAFLLFSIGPWTIMSFMSMYIRK